MSRLTTVNWLLVAIAPVIANAGEIAFTRDASIWIVDTVTGEERIITDDPGYDRPIVWTPDGKRILFWKHSDVGWDFWTVRFDGSDIQRLTETRSGGNRSASFSKDGKRIAYMRDSPQGVYIMDADGNTQRQLADSGHRDDPPSWSPDSAQLLFYELNGDDQEKLRRGLYTVTVQNDEAQRAEDQRRFIYDGWNGAFSPIRNEIICLARAEASATGNANLVLVNLDTSESRDLTDSQDNDQSPVWSPDGEHIAYVRSAGKEQSQVCVVSRSGDDHRVLVTTDAVGRPHLRWSPDGSQIAFLAALDETVGIFIVSSAGGEAKLLTAVTGFFEWRPDPLAHSAR